MSGALPRRLVELASGPNFAAVTTILDGGQPQTQLMWVDTDGDHLIVNTETRRAKFRNVQRDPRITVTVWDRDDPYFFVEARGEVTEIVRGRRALDHIDELCHRYRGHHYDRARIQSERVMLFVTPHRIVSR